MVAPSSASLLGRAISTCTHTCATGVPAALRVGSQMCTLHLSHVPNPSRFTAGATTGTPLAIKARQHAVALARQDSTALYPEQSCLSCAEAAPSARRGRLSHGRAQRGATPTLSEYIVRPAARVVGPARSVLTAPQCQFSALPAASEMSRSSLVRSAQAPAPGATIARRVRRSPPPRLAQRGTITQTRAWATRASASSARWEGSALHRPSCRRSVPNIFTVMRRGCRHRIVRVHAIQRRRLALQEPSPQSIVHAGPELGLTALMPSV